MLLAAFDFLQMKVADILDILLLGIIIFLLFKWLRGTSAMSIFVAIVSLYMIRVIVGAFDMRLMSAIMDMILDVGVLAIIVIFQPEIRKFLIRLGNRYMNNAKGRAIIDKLTGKEKKVHCPVRQELHYIVSAVLFLRGQVPVRRLRPAPEEDLTASVLCPHSGAPDDRLPEWRFQ